MTKFQNIDWMRLSFDEKKSIINDALMKWKAKEPPYASLQNKYDVAFVALGEYYNQPPHTDGYYTNPYNPEPKDLIGFVYKTPPAEWQNDCIKIVNLLEVHSL